MWRLWPRVNVRAGGGEEGGCGRALRARSQAPQTGLWISPAKGCGSGERLRRGGVGVGGVGHAAGRLSDQRTWSMKQSQPRTTRRGLEPIGLDSMAKPLTQMVKRGYHTRFSDH